jgi:hypothetical protein
MRANRQMAGTRMSAFLWRGENQNAAPGVPDAASIEIAVWRLA